MSETRRISHEYAEMGEALIEAEEAFARIRGSRAAIIFLASDHAKRSRERAVLGECERVRERDRWAIPADFLTEVLDAGGRPVEALLLEALFDGNPAWASVEVVEGTHSPRDGAYALFEPRVARFFADDLSDFAGIRSTLYQEVVKDVMPVDGVRYCTAVANPSKA